MRIFIGLRELSGYYHHLKKGFDAMGIESVFVNLSGHPYQYGTDDNPAWINKLNNLAQRAGSGFFKNWALRVLWTVFLQNIISAFLFFWALFRFDAFIFASNSTFFFFLDLPILKLFNKKIIYVFHGSEARPVYLNGYVINDDRPGQIITAIILARMQKIMISIIDRFADYCINIPPQAYFHARPFISWLMIGVPQSARDESVPADEAGDGTASAVRILHAPSKPGPKGTPVIRSIIEKLQGKGHKIEFVEITGRPNAEVQAELRRCDFIIDEIYSDTPMAVFATEAAFAGRPAVVGGYYSSRIGDDVPPESIPPSLFCHPDDLERSVEKMVADVKFRKELGRKAYHFVMSHWSAEKVACRFIALLKGDAPKEWLYDPCSISYLHGCGLHEDKARRIIGRLIETGGVGALCLSDKPGLQNMFVDFSSRH